MGYEESVSLLRDVLPPLGGGEEEGGGEEGVDALLAAYLIGVRMNRETDRELKAFCLAFDDAGEIMMIMIEPNVSVWRFATS